MLLSLAGSAASSLVSAGAGWFTRGLGDGALQAGNAPITPRDPPTVSLALIGAGTLAVYFLVLRRPSRLNRPLMTSYLRHRSMNADAASQEKPRESRGAA